jgi:hypothetical protein
MTRSVGKVDSVSRETFDMFIIPNAQILYVIWPGTLGAVADLWISIWTAEIREPAFRRVAVRRTGPEKLGEKSWE